MISEYVLAALRRANYEIQDGVFSAIVTELPGVSASGATLEECRNHLINIIELSLLFWFRVGKHIPILDEIDLNIPVESPDKSVQSIRMVPDDAGLPLGVYMRMHRENQGYTQGELGNKVGITKQAVSRIENGENFIAPHHVPAYALALNIDPMEIARRNS